MKKKCLCLLLALSLLVLCGCAGAGEPVDTTPQQESDLDSCAQSSGYHMAETEDGYYLLQGDVLYFADKSNITNWVSVCSQPDCKHDKESCPAHVGANFYLSGERIYSVRNVGHVDGTVSGAAAVYSTRLDGSDFRKDYEIPDTSISAGGSAIRLLGGTVYGACAELRNDGTCHNRFFCADETGSETWLESTTDTLSPPLILTATEMYGMRGDLAVLCNLFAEPGATSLRPCRLKEEGYEAVAGLDAFRDTDLIGAWLEGDTLLRFAPNDGYYRTDLSTGTSEKLREPYLTDSRAYHLTPQCIVETNVVDVPPDHPVLAVRQGETWQEVALPEDFWPEGDVGLEIIGASESCLFLRINALTGSNAATLYTVDLTADNLEAVFCAEFT